jgi:hypothetical protein
VFCDQEHFLSESNHFLPNKAIESIIGAEIAKLNLGDDYDEACYVLENLDELKNTFDQIRNNPEEFLYEKFRAMRHKVDLVRERLIQKINDYSDKIIADIDSYENECKLNLPEFKSNIQSDKFDLANFKDDLTKWHSKMNKLYSDEDLCSEINSAGDGYLSSVEAALKEAENHLLTGQTKRREFETKYLNILDVFCKQLNFKR